MDSARPFRSSVRDLDMSDGVVAPTRSEFENRDRVISVTGAVDAEPDDHGSQARPVSTAGDGCHRGPSRSRLRSERQHLGIRNTKVTPPPGVSMIVTSPP